jgi:hypothetical protein
MPSRAPPCAKITPHSQTSKGYKDTISAEKVNTGMIDTSNKPGMKMKKEGKRSFLKSIAPGERLRFRNDVLKHVQTREWIFKTVEKDGTVSLVHERGGFGWKVRVDDIDWEAYRKTKE